MAILSLSGRQDIHDFARLVEALLQILGDPVLQHHLHRLFPRPGASEQQGPDESLRLLTKANVVV